MKVLLVYPEHPLTFWSFKHVLKFVSKRSAFPPLGLLTVAALLPQAWEKRLVDMNTTKLKDSDIAWADYLFIGGMIVQKESAREVIARASSFSCRVVAGGPLFTSTHEEFPGVDHFVLNEAEVTLPLFLKDLEEGTLKKIYTSPERPDIKKTPLPLWDLIDMKHYASMSVQYSRGCPFDCEFCDIVVMNGRRPRTKANSQMLGELDTLYQKGWRGPVFIVDDNFIGNKAKAQELFASLIPWVKAKKYPFAFFTEASLNLADETELLSSMVKAGFDKVFLGIETPIESSLVECGKFQNKNCDMALAIQRIQQAGLEVMGGFIIGFDNDPPSIFERQMEFIQKTGVVAAMVGLLNALPGTRLHKRLHQEGRLLKTISGSNTDGVMNFIPKMDFEKLKTDYQSLIKKIYSPQVYYERIYNFLQHYKPAIKTPPSWTEIKAFLYSVWELGIWNRSRGHYWKLIIWSLLKYPKAFSKAVCLAIYGYHFEKVADLS